MKIRHNKGIYKWLIIWLIQFLSIMLITMILSLTTFLGTTFMIIGMYILLPLISSVLTCKCVQYGLNNYLALVAPIFACLAGYTIVWGYLPAPGPVLLCELITVVGAASGEVLRSRKTKENK